MGKQSGAEWRAECPLGPSFHLVFPAATKAKSSEFSSENTTIINSKPDFKSSKEAGGGGESRF